MYVYNTKYLFLIYLFINVFCEFQCDLSKRITQKGSFAENVLTLSPSKI